MGLFDLFKRKKTKSFSDHYAEENLVVNIWESISEKCDYGNAIEKLNEHERVIFLTQSLEVEVNNGGFSQFFYNSSGDHSNELTDAFTKIGALKTAEICKKALSVFKGDVPTDRYEREDLLLYGLDEEKCDAVWEKCDDAFYEYEDDLEELNRAYIMKYREFFD